MAGWAPWQECDICTWLTLGAALREAAFHAGRSDASTRCCHLASEVLADTVSLCVTESGRHFVTAKSKLTTQTSHNVMQLIFKVFHLQREKKCTVDSQLPTQVRGVPRCCSCSVKPRAGNTHTYN